jgi:hypothetical protein
MRRRIMRAVTVGLCAAGLLVTAAAPYGRPGISEIIQALGF